MPTKKQLQSNFTTPEQSERLLGLGVFADSADCYYYKNHEDRIHVIPDGSTIIEMQNNIKFGMPLPCWSVGRLIEIMSKLISSGQYCVRVYDDTNIIDKVVGDIEREIKLGYIDFSKFGK